MENLNHKILNIYHVLSTILMAIFGFAIIIYLALNLYDIITALVLEIKDIQFSDITQSILTVFLCFELLVIIKSFFKNDENINTENYIYIALTAITKNVLVNHDNAQQTLFLCGSVLLLVIALVIAQTRGKKNSS
ncbi:phosphate-starvation-inducible PsiE family protein [Leuconostoc citreum]|uniref:phosphate-starvation-inducible PsiE family protein n=1 Tax=Leuconostoc citreum TaxID=33964 RepID=UPI0002466814|nr:phosphate-starvation-inducible PsiE family protein [Leuconostoc citreum]MCS8586963.1 hypothetical protein [Leuconostoc citreum]MCS8595893.1 hypothetical protein [Leuconostoc citreum]MCS8598557.1 hypothetical protein [Leuconostoc citreum]WMS77931.1 phosphate-starvation-inducible PsiE family protein [Leuconostoc citreum]CCF25135.1 Phosphate-starvation-inducible E subfamily [Leuconostoc citreum LBAE C10]